MKLFTVDKRRKISEWTWQTLPKRAFCKVLAVLKTISFLCNINCLLFNFFVWYLASVWQGQLMTSLQTSTNVLSTANVLVTTIKALEKITLPYKNKTKKRRLHVAPLKETLSKLMIFFSSKTLALENILTVFLHCNLIWLLLFFLKRIYMEFSIFLWKNEKKW